MFFVGRVFFENVSAVDGKSPKTSEKSLLETPKSVKKRAKIAQDRSWEHFWNDFCRTRVAKAVQERPKGVQERP